ncbi:polysaccharide deacetylase family protein [Bacteroides sp. 519]|uniref:polysaccharide deacetylase family protein n=1 Tax=Bacteroides sp. 519 TaxID=2302937 RepID=UPI0013D5E030|nr:polysaccharide deacetylase family protein [Bacteroides sp. 519]NDV60699.1 polysaccharide deacetylase family protein [Bacteroides sp. 519]
MLIFGFVLLMLAILTFFFYASYSIGSGVYLKAYCRKKTSEKVVTLTFDDGPDSIQTPKVLDILKARNISATFFCIGHKLTGNEDIIKRIEAEGHTIGNHSYSHSGVFPLYSSAKIKQDLQHCQQLLYSITGKETKWFRPPFGVTNPPIAKAVKELGYHTIGWNIRSLDTQGMAHQKVLGRIRKRLCPGSIILLHDRMPDSDILLLKVLDLLDEEGYRIVGLNEII